MVISFLPENFRVFLKRAENPTQFELSLEELPHLYSNPAIWEKVVRELARNIALLVNSLNMSMVNVFGTFVLDGPKMKEIIREEIQTNWL